MSWWVNSWISVELVSAVPTQPAASQGEGCSSSEGWYVYQHFLFHFPFHDIYRRLLFFTLIRYVCTTLAITSLLEGFTPPSSARTKGDDTRYYVYTYLVRIPTFLLDFPFDEIYRRLLFFTLGRMYHTL